MRKSIDLVKMQKIKHSVILVFMNKENLLYLLFIPVIFAAVFIFAAVPERKQSLNKEQKINNSDFSMKGENTMDKPEMTIDREKDYQAVLTTSVGQITVDLGEDDTPVTVNNFVYLAENDFYQDTIFHRVIKDFMIQGGCPKGDGTGGPGYSFADEDFSGEYTRGTLAMANAGPNTNGSQFFIMHKDRDLPKNYVIFGHVVQGMDVVDKIANVEVEQSPAGEMSLPKQPVRLEEVEIITN
jgi:peptidylprolyl isomerase